jgi:hypothetical protein
MIPISSSEIHSIELSISPIRSTVNVFSDVATPLYPIEVSDSAAGVTYQFFQVQDGRHTTIAPDGFAEASFVQPPWMK